MPPRARKQPGRAASRFPLGTAALLVVLAAPAAFGAEASVAEDSAWSRAGRVLSLRDHNTRVVLLGTTLLGLAAGTVGTFMLLRKRALMSDALSHATLPGIALAFILMVQAGGTGKALPGLLLGALLSGGLAILAILATVQVTRLKQDAVLGIVLSVFFGVGTALLGFVQRMAAGSAAGLEQFIYGKTASMVAGDAWLIAVVAALVTGLSLLFFKEMKLLCFDPTYAAARGWSVFLLDMVLMSLVAAVTVVGLQAVGLILVIALLVTPAAAARFWTERLGRMTLLSAAIGALSGLGGALLSALAPRLPAGALIVVVTGVLFMLSMLFGARRGVLRRVWSRRALARRIARQHLLRALYEALEPTAMERPGATPSAVPLERLQTARTWSPGELRSAVADALSAGWIRSAAGGGYALTERGWQEARRVVRNHRLWELFLVTHAELATSQVDRDADRVEHVLEPEMIAELETLLAEQEPHLAMPPSPHALPAGKGN